MSDEVWLPNVMKVVCSLLACTCLTGLADPKFVSERKESPAWIEGSKRLKDYRKQFEGRPLLVVFGADWDLHGAVFRKFVEGKEVRKELRERDFVLIWYDLSNKEKTSIPYVEMRGFSRGIYDLSFAVVVSGAGGSPKLQSLRGDFAAVKRFLARLIRDEPGSEVPANP